MLVLGTAHTILEKKKNAGYPLFYTLTLSKLTSKFSYIKKKKGFVHSSTMTCQETEITRASKKTQFFLSDIKGRVSPWQEAT